MSALLRANLNESPSEKEGKCEQKVVHKMARVHLNESPSEKEGKFPLKPRDAELNDGTSMKVPPKRKGNNAWRLVADSPDDVPQ